MSELEGYLTEFHEILPANDEIFYNSLEKRRALERQLQICIENVIDISFMLLKLLGIGPPQNEENVFTLLHSHLSNTKNLQKMKGFRNILIHQYGKIDQQRILQFSRENMSDFDIFLHDVKNILKKVKN